MSTDVDDVSLDVAGELKRLDELLPDDVTGIISSFSGKNQKSVRAIRSKDAAQALKGVYKFESAGDPVFVRTVRLYGVPSDISKSLQLSVIFPDGTTGNPQSFGNAKDSPYSYVYVHRVISGFQISTKNGRGFVEIRKIEITGQLFSALEEAGENLSAIVKIREGITSYKKKVLSELQELEEKKAGIQAELVTLGAELDSAKDETGTATSELDQIRTALASETIARDKILSENRSYQNTQSQLDSRVKELNKEVSKGELELRQLTEKRRLISDEFSSFVDEGRGQARIYGFISILPAVMAAVALGFLIYGGWTYAKLVVATPTQAYAFFIQRLPYTMATVTIVGLLLEILRQIVKKIMTIHEDRLALARLLVIARDVTYAAASDLEMNEDQIFTERMKVKMQLLKAHLGLEDPSSKDKVDSEKEE